MMGHNNDSKLSIAIAVSVVALVLSVYATLSVTQMGSSMETNGTDLEPEIRRVIQAYVDEQVDQAAAPPVPLDPVEVDEGTGIVKGDDNAPVTLVEFSDYECPFCKRFFEETLPQIQAEYIDTGKVRHVFRDFPLAFHARATPAANAARCVLDAGNLDDYWAYHDLLFQNQSNLSDEALKTYASQINGIDQNRVTQCMDEGEFVADVEADFLAGQQLGITGTPGFFINGRLLSGAQPFSAFQAVIEAELNAAQ